MSEYHVSCGMFGIYADDSVFLGFAIHPYLSLDRTVSLVNWYKQTGLHGWQSAEHIVTRWKEVNLDVV